MELLNEKETLLAQVEQVRSEKESGEERLSSLQEINSALLSESKEIKGRSFDLHAIPEFGC